MVTTQKIPIKDAQKKMKNKSKHVITKKINKTQRKILRGKDRLLSNKIENNKMAVVCISISISYFKYKWIKLFDKDNKET
jgi:ACT domain-containing protein